MTQRELKALIINDKNIVNQHINIAARTIYGKAADDKLARPAWEGRPNGLAPNGTIFFGNCSIKRGEQENYAVYLNYFVMRNKKRRKKLGEMTSLYDAIKFAVASDYIFALTLSLAR